MVSINCSVSQGPVNQTLEPGGTPGCKFDGLTIESAGLPPGAAAVRVYAGGVQGTTILATESVVYSDQGVKDAQDRPVGSWKQTHGAGWIMSGPAKTEALVFLSSGADKPSRTIYADGSEKHMRSDAPANEPATVMQGQLSNAKVWNPPPIGPGKSATLEIDVAGAEMGGERFSSKRLTEISHRFSSKRCRCRHRARCAFGAHVGATLAAECYLCGWQSGGDAVQCW